jgi:hypothetical protein
MSRKFATGIAAFALTGVLALGGTAFASGSGDGGTGPSGDRAAKVCANLDVITQTANDRIAEITQRIQHLTELRDTAAAAGGHDALVTRLDNKITQLNARLAKVQDRLAKLPAWAAAHCTPPAPAA